MTRIPPRKEMNSSEKRRGPPGNASPSRRAVGSSSNSSSSAPSTSTPTSNSSGSARPSATPNMIAPPPRAALSSSSSPSPDDHRNRERDSSPASNVPAAGSSLGESGSSGGSAHVPTSAAALQTLLRERDARILTLERELEILEAEFRRELEKRSTTESETATFWQAKHSALHTQFLRADAELRLLRADAQQAERRTAEREELLAGWDKTRRELAACEEEVRDLRAQVRGLKEWVSTSTRSGEETRTSDEVFGEGMARLGNSLQNWVIVNFRRAKIDFAMANISTLNEVNRLVPMYEELAVTSKVHLLQSIVSRLLVELVFQAYFVGLSEEQERQFTQMETLLGSCAGSPESVNQWRSLTLTILKKDAAQKMQDEAVDLTRTVIVRVNNILRNITDSTATGSRDQGLRALVASAIELSRLLVVQKAVFKVLMPEILPHQRITFDPATMEDIGGEDEDSLTEREICCVTFPGIIKRGDENGGQLQFRNVISKARVLCSPE